MHWKGLLSIIPLFVGSLVLAQPVNDNCANAIDIPVESGSCTSPTYTNVGATSPATDPDPSCWAPDGPDNTVWFTFSPIGTAVQISTNFTSVMTNSQVAIYSGSCGSLTEVSCQEDLFAAGGVTHVTLLVDGLTPGATYYVMVDGNFGEEASFGICAEDIVVGAPEPNQDCPTGEFLCDETEDIFVGDGPGSDGLIEEVPSCFGGTGERSSEWYIFTAENTGTFTFELDPSSPTDFDWGLYDITGSPAGTCDLGDELSCNWIGSTGITGLGCGGAACEPTENLVAGNTYALMIDRWTATSASGYTLTFGGTVNFANPEPTFSATTVCVGQPTVFSNTTSGSNLYSWTFGDGFTSSDDNPSHTYAAAGTYTVTLIATANPGGCTGVVVETVTVVEGPELTIDPLDPTICTGESVDLDLSYTLTASDCPPETFSNPTDIAIPAGPSISSDIVVSGISPSTFSTSMLESVCLNIDHAFTADLDIYLECPDGTQIALCEDEGGGGDNFTGTCFIVSGVPSITTGSAPFTGEFTPEEPFSMLTGCDVNGTWSLIVDDDLSGITGTLLDWSITFACTNDVESTIWTPATGLSSTTVEDPTATPGVTTTYTVTMTETSGCSASASTTVTVSPPAAAGFTYAGSPYCTDETDPLPVLDAGASAGSWSASPAGLVINALTGSVDLSVSSAGTYTITNTVAGPGSCPDATDTYSITIAPSYAISLSPEICTGDTYILPDGSTVSSGGVYVSMLVSDDGCDSVITTNLSVLAASSTTVTTSICTGDTYILPDGSVVSAAGTYISTLVAASGCDSIITTNLSLSAAASSTITTEICSGDIYVLPDGSTVSTGGTYSSTLSTASGCDSIVTVNLSVLSSTSSTIDAGICTGATYTLPDGSTVSASGTYTTTLINAAGCDSVVTTNLTVSDSYLTNLNPSICDDEVYVLPDGSSTSIAGVYSFDYISTDGCDSTVTVDLTVNANTSTTLDIAICDGESILLPDGTVIIDPPAGFYSYTFTSVAGCDSTVSVNLSVGAVYASTIDAEICTGGAYVLPDGTSVSTDGTYITNLTTVGGCDSIITTNVTVSDSYLISLTPSICDDEVYVLPDGSSTSTSGVYSFDYISTTGCDSTVTVDLTVNANTSTTLDIAICDGESILLPDGTVIIDPPAGFYSYTFTSAAGCDSTVSVNLSVGAVYASTIDAEICTGGAYVLPDGTSVSTDGTYITNLTTVGGCDSIITTNVTVSDSYLISLTPSICDDEVYVLPDGSSTSTSGVYSFDYISTTGCDSTVTVDLTVNANTSTTLDIAICDGESILLPDGTVIIDPPAGFYSYTFTSAAGCDSTVNVNLSVGAVYASTIDAEICTGGAYVLPDGTSVSTDGTYITNLTTVGGCDSIITTNVTVSDAYLISLTPSICDDEVYILPDGSSTSTAGVYSFDYISTTGCDSTVTVDLTVNANTSTTLDIAICDGESILLPDGTVIIDPPAGFYSYTFTSAAGCDSTVNVNLSVGAVYASTIDAEICTGGAYVLPDGTSVSTDGTYITNLTTVGGCDSIITTNVTVSDAYLISLTPSICDDEVYVLPDGSSTSTAGVYSFDYISTTGCDSTVSVNLSVNPTYNIVFPFSICEGETILLPDGTVIIDPPAGLYEYTFLTAAGCDSTYAVDLTVSPVYDIDVDAEICDGGTYTLPDGTVVAAAGTYISSLSTVSGCDSIITTTLNVIDVLTTDIVTAICDDETYMLPDGSSTASAGMYTYNLISAAGCDSIVTVDLTVHPTYSTILPFSICDGETILLPDGTLVSDPPAGVYTYTFTSVDGCDSVYGVDLSVLPVYDIAISASICDGDTYTLPDGSATSVAGTYIFNFTTAAFCDSTVTVNLDVLPALTTTITEQICSGETVVLPDGTSTGIAGTYIFNLVTDAGCDSVVTFNLTVNPLPVVDVFMTSDGFCLNEGIQGFGISPIGGSIYGPGVTGFSFDPVLAGVGGPYDIWYTYTDASGCADSAMTTVSVYAVPTVSFSMPPDVCLEDDPLLLNGAPPGGVYTGPGIIDTMFMPSVADAGSASITYQYTDANGCEAEVIAGINVIENTLDAGADVSITLGDSVMLFVTSDGTLSWSPVNDLSCTNCNNPIASPLQTTTYTVTETDVYGCQAQDEVTVVVNLPEEYTLYVPNTFTPNGDNHNDFFFVFGINIARVEAFRVYDRWGELIFEGLDMAPTDYERGWDGTFAGKPLNAGVYAYMVQVRTMSGEVIQQAGNVTIVR
jgi:gliding motility-associated-like protein